MSVFMKIKKLKIFINKLNRRIKVLFNLSIKIDFQFENFFLKFSNLKIFSGNFQLKGFFFGKI